MVRLCGAALGFLAFSVAILLGLWSHNPFDVILTRALWAMVGFFALGLATGWVAWRVLDEHALKRDRELEAELRKAQAKADQQARHDDETQQTDRHDRSPVGSGDPGADVLPDAAPVP
jgi:hypothetical protein